jgi:SAM-dependent methyltransferase
MSTAAKFDSIAAGYAAGQAGRLDLARVRALLRAGREDLALDVATGTGAVARAFAADVRAVVGVDVSAGMLETAAAALAGEGAPAPVLLQADAARLPFATACFDIVTCSRAIHHMERPREALAEMFRVARPGARLLVVDSTSYEEEEWARLHNDLERLRDPSHVRGLAPTELRELVGAAGFRIEWSGLEESSRSLRVWLEDVAAGADETEAVDRWIGAARGESPDFCDAHFVEAPAGEAAFRYRLTWILARKEG